mgnify:CR=1 FL=1
MIVLALDQAKKTGVAIFNDSELIYHDLIQSKFERYEDVIIDISNKLSNLINKYHPDIVLLEDVQSMQNQKTYKDLCMLLGCLISTCHSKNTNYEIISCNTWRKVLKNNLPYHGKKKQRAEWKQAAQEFVKQRFNLKLNNDTAEAICIALYYIEREVE